METRRFQSQRKNRKPHGGRNGQANLGACMRRFFSPWVFIQRIVLLVIVYCAACSGEPSLYPVEGTVLHKGKPISGVIVSFHRKGADPITNVPSTGFTKEDGTFILSTGKNSGAPAGEYIVTFACFKEVAAKKEKKPAAMEMGKETEDFFKGAYLDASKSAFKVDIKSGSTKLEPFRLD
jgi:hypothetical protein